MLTPAGFPPARTEEQRNAALEKSRATRRARAELRRDLKAGRLTLEDVLEGDLDIAQRMKVHQLLTSLPFIGPVRAAAIMDDLGIIPNRRVQGLGTHQTRALLARFGYDTHL